MNCRNILESSWLKTHSVYKIHRQLIYAAVYISSYLCYEVSFCGNCDLLNFLNIVIGAVYETLPKSLLSKAGSFCVHPFMF